MHSRTAPPISPQLDGSQRGFRWSADSLVGTLVSVLSSRSSSHTFVAFTDIKKAFDRSYVEGTVVRLFDAGVSGLQGTQSQVRTGASLSAPWDETGIAQERVLSPLLFNLLVNGLEASVRQAARGVQFGSSLRFTDKLFADDLVVPAECQHYLQVAFDVVSAWGHRWRFSFWIGPTKSAPMVFGPRTSVPPCSVFLSGQVLPLVSEYLYLEVVMTTSLSWPARARDLVSRGSRPFAQCVSWNRSERLTLRFASALFTSYVLPSISWGEEFFVSPLNAPKGDRHSLAQVEPVPLGLANWFPCRCCLLGIGVVRRCSYQHHSVAPSLFGRMQVICPLPALVFGTMLSEPESWVARRVSMCESFIHSSPWTLWQRCGVLCTQCALVLPLKVFSTLTDPSTTVCSRLHAPLSATWIAKGGDVFFCKRRFFFFVKGGGGFFFDGERSLFWCEKGFLFSGRMFF